MMLFSFFVFRVIYYTYMVFFGIFMFDFVDSKKNWESYPDTGIHNFIIFLQVAFTAMYGLNLFWFKKILMGALKALGFFKPSPKKDKNVELAEKAAKNK